MKTDDAMSYKIKSWMFTIQKIGTFHILPSIIIGKHDDGWYLTGGFIRWIWIIKNFKYQNKIKV